jgi:hypothetical protein
MYSIRKFSDCWAVFNLANNESRALTEEERAQVQEAIPTLADPGTVAWYGDDLECITNKP